MTNSALHKPAVLVVDDTPQNLKLMVELLRDQYQTLVANSGARALAIARGPQRPDIILLDIMMPEMDGYEVLRQLKADALTRHIPVIFLTAKSEVEDETLGLELGAVDYITKPISPPIVLARVKSQLLVKDAADFLRNQNQFLEAEVVKRTQRLEAIQDVTVMVMTSMAETRDNETGNHIMRTQRYVERLARHLQPHPRFAPLLTEDYIKLLFKSAPLHDIGKVGIPDHILLKPGPLTAEEFETMKQHTSLGYEAITRAETSLGTEVDFLRIAKEIALSHHEKWNGSGYPKGLSGDEIPVSARLMAIADVYDALVSKRVYKSAMTHAQAAEIIVSGKGQHFDPDVCDAFIAVQSDFQDIATAYADT
jgi:putative two-component system response regulator